MSTAARPSGMTLPGSRGRRSRPSWPGAPRTTVTIRPSGNATAAGRTCVPRRRAQAVNDLLLLVRHKALVGRLDVRLLLLGQADLGRRAADVEVERARHLDRDLGRLDPPSLGVERHLALVHLVVRHL